MMIEYLVGPIVAVVVSLKYTAHVVKKQQETCSECCEKITLVEKKLEVYDKEILQRVMTTVLPIAKAVNKLNNEVGIR